MQLYRLQVLGLPLLLYYVASSHASEYSNDHGTMLVASNGASEYTDYTLMASNGASEYKDDTLLASKHASRAINYTDPPVFRNIGDTFTFECIYTDSDITGETLIQFFKEYVEYLTIRGSRGMWFSHTPGYVNSSGLFTRNGTEMNYYLKNLTDSDRYSITLEPVGTQDTRGRNLYRYTMKITDLQPEDSGNSGCQLTDLVNLAKPTIISQVTKNLIVIGPVFGIEVAVSETEAETPGDIKNKTVLQDGEEYTFHSGQLLYLSIGINYTNVHPREIKVFIGPNETTVEYEPKPPGNPFSSSYWVLNGTPLLKTRFIVYLYWDMDFVPQGSFNGKNLYVIVTPDGNYDVMSWAVRLNVTYPPTDETIQCASYDVKSALGSQVELTCSVKANPAADVWWEYEHMPLNMSDPRYVVNTVIEDDKTTSTLVIANVSESDEGFYMIKGENHYGEMTYVSEEKQVQFSIGYTDQAHHVQLDTTLAIATCLISLFLKMRE